MNASNERLITIQVVAGCAGSSRFRCIHRTKKVMVTSRIDCVMSQRKSPRSIILHYLANTQTNTQRSDETVRRWQSNQTRRVQGQLPSPSPTQVVRGQQKEKREETRHDDFFFIAIDCTTGGRLKKEWPHSIIMCLPNQRVMSSNCLGRRQSSVSAFRIKRVLVRVQRNSWWRWPLVRSRPLCLHRIRFECE